MGKLICCLFVLGMFFSCVDGNKEILKEEREFVKSPTVRDMYKLYGKEEYTHLYDLFNDSVNNHGKINYKDLGFEPSLILDSIYFMNRDEDFVIGNIIYLAHGNSMDGIFPVFFRKFQGNWYINGGGSQPLTSKNLTYDKVHRIINKGQSHRIYRKKGTNQLFVKEEMFEKDGYSDQGLKKTISKLTYPDSRHEWSYQQYFVEASISDHYRKTYWQLHYLPSNYSFVYSRSKKELIVTAKIPYWNDFPLDHTGSWLDKYNTRINSWENREVIRKGQKYTFRKYQGIEANQEIDLLYYMAMKINIQGMEATVYRFRISNGKVRFMKLVPHERGLLDYFSDKSKQEQDSARIAWQYLIDRTFGKDYGKDCSISSEVMQ